MTKIKVCGMVHPLNVEEVSALEPELMGFIFYEGSRRYIGPDPDPEIFRITGPATKKVGVFVNEMRSVVLRLSEQYGLDMVQLHGEETPRYCDSLRESGLTVIKTLPPEVFVQPGKADAYMGHIDLFLLDSASAGKGGTGKKFNWEILQDLELHLPYLLSGGIGPSDAPAIRDMEQDLLFGVDVNSGFESSPGVKDVERLDQFIRILRK